MADPMDENQLSELFKDMQSLIDDEDFKFEVRSMERRATVVLDAVRSCAVMDTMRAYAMFIGRGDQIMESLDRAKRLRLGDEIRKRDGMDDLQETRKALGQYLARVDLVVGDEIETLMQTNCGCRLRESFKPVARY